MARTKTPGAGTSAAVDALLDSLDHPRKREILALRQILLGVDPSISEEVKWNAPSFRTTEHFATMHLRAKDGVRLILHFGAKKRDVAGVAIADPEGLLEWLGADRASIVFADACDLEAKRTALERLVRQWIASV